MLKIFIFLWLFSFPCLAADELPPEADASQKLVEQYAAQGVLAAQRLKNQFEQMDKPAFQKAYDEYLQDLKIIAETGRAADNENLYQDLLRMNSDEEMVYDILKGHIRVGFGHILHSR